MEKNELSEAEVNKIKKTLRDMLAVDRHRLLMKFPFIGDLAMHFDLVPVRDCRCPTACTDGKAIYFDCDFYSSLSQTDRVFVFAHEIFHNMLLHFNRRQTRNPDLFNIATDMEVNHLLKQNIDGNNSVMTCPKDLVYPPHELEGKSAEVIYDALLKKNKSSGQTSSGKRGGSSNGTMKPSSESSASSGCDKGKLSGQFDKHSYKGDDEPESQGDGFPSDKWGKVTFDPDFKPSVSGDAAEKMREAIVSAAQKCERTRGKLPAGLESILDKIKRPQLSWRELLCEFVTKCYTGDMTYLPPNRRHVYNDMYFQSRRSDRVSIAVCVDTSGSCIQDLPQFFGELKGLVESFGSYEINLYMADADIASHEVYDEANPLDIIDAGSIKWAGGGGTSFCPFFDALADDSEHETKCAIYLTDGYGDAPKDPPPYPVLWILTKDGNTDFCSWGEKIKLTSSGYDY